VNRHDDASGGCSRSSSFSACWRQSCGCFGFEQHGLERILSVTAVSHAAARRVMERAGLTHEGTRYWMSSDVPVAWYAIDRATGNARRA
jgi:hypothetical protein